ncbi:C6 transcription factor [Colletotrichum truncatum]|uniref:C6 transcription factor n=1 Tax=Colletotrichum truncatum TaxID=5467 RepID=A0ACC3YH17_COLTU|nr:C6 transcription factor [Colletotrichum truncatum]KAF6784130.1 C6 transcription factor [Colletotrichum truncatum]
MATKPAGTRSTDGCWTCRLRRKKCDETPPVCQTCTSLGITCHGYGVRPSWMDRGPLEKEKAQSIKLEIARNGIKRKRPRLFSTTSATSAEASSGTGAGADNSNRDAAQLETALCLSKYLPNGLQTVMNDEFDDDFSLSSMAMHHQTTTDTMIERMSVVGREISPSEVLSPDGSEMDRYSLPVDPLLHLGHGWDSSDSAFDYEACMQMGSFLPMETPASLPEVLHRVGQSGSSDAPSCYSGRSSGTNNSGSSTTSGEIPLRDAISLSSYLDETLSAQFPFRRSSDVSCRQWLEFLLFSSKHVLGVTLLLSRAPDSASENPDSAQEKWNENQVLRAMAVLRSLPSATSSLSMLDEELKASHIITTCACVLQTIFLEVHLGGTSQWTSCLEQVAPYMHALINLVVCSANNSSNDLNTTAESTVVLRVQTAAAKALLGQLAWFDIIGLVSTGCGPSLGTNHPFLLDSNAFDLKETSGCENWVAKSLYEIHLLRKWKAEEEDARRLSIIKLAERGATIIEFLGKHIAATDNDEDDEDDDMLSPKEPQPRAIDSDASSSSAGPLEQDIKTITMAYARAAVIYLHVIISGPNPLLEDIRRETPRLVKDLKELTSAGLLGNASFPLCVAACFGEDQDFNFFKHFISTNRGTRPKRFETCDKAVMIAEECRNRRQNGKSCDWVSLTQEVGWKYLLV